MSTKGSKEKPITTRLPWRDTPKHLRKHFEKAAAQETPASTPASTPSTPASTPTPETPSTSTDLLTFAQAASELSIGLTKVKELVRDGELGRVKIGRKTRIPRDTIATYVKRHRRG